MSHFTDLLDKVWIPPDEHGLTRDLPTSSLTTNSSWLPWRKGSHASHQPSDDSTPTSAMNHHHQVARPSVSIAVSTSWRHFERSCARSHAELKPKVMGPKVELYCTEPRPPWSTCPASPIRWRTIDGCSKNASGLLIFWSSILITHVPKIVCTWYLFSSTLGQRSIIYKGPSLWNTLPHEMKGIRSVSLFAHKLKEIIS